MVEVAEIRALPGKGLEGDRYFGGVGTYSKNPGDRQVTFIEKEAIDSLERESEITIGPGEARRNLVTTGLALNHLIDREFQVGDVRFRGIKLCEPCNHLESLTKVGVRAALVHRGGLRAEVLSEGMLRKGDPVIVG